MATEFFNTADSTFAGYDITDTQIKTLRDYLESNTIAEEAVKQLTVHPEESSTPVEMKKRLGGLWTLLNDTAVRLPSAQPKIISILRTIRKLPKAQEPKGAGEEYIDLDDGFYWKELTDWANNWADAFNSHASRFLVEQPADGQDKANRRVAWTSACEYTGRLAATGDDALSSYGAGLERATRAIAEALEVDTGNEEPDSVEAAAELFLYAGSELYRCCQEGQKYGMLNSPASMWKGDEGFSQDRWRFWGERWNALSKAESLSADTRRIAKQSVEAMKQVEYMK
ncbi:hypothetical protein P153DRAFT_331481 [Dothidotthia symphoricarpi CBS 119687]|uniref:Uncharacterized protein n=1 Tax=Dothidotthia symphoricarpi CBS 119687 TaxID=1392245 RepID=A0A6A6ARE9_9PLEO|nr:uncharacterized protein P153DRAFT_331481 [Dothidotthia symphoricarpi CBS 119687]KAF2133091.1 hypothetical protein P153DRAFT_331481 [Dothidotthia symphoricarpi CBS 119687]